jgi:NTP pyrophosphatase (non-canonical NTP hydrolase)
MENGEFGQLIERIVRFRNEREWKKFHNPKDMALSLVLEAAEVLEHFQWKSEEEANSYIKTKKDDIGEELADVLYWVLLMSHDMNVDIMSAFEKKMKKNEDKYPASQVKGSSRKYTEY